MICSINLTYGPPSISYNLLSLLTSGPDGATGEGLLEDDEGYHGRRRASQDVPGVRASSRRYSRPSPPSAHGRVNLVKSSISSPYNNF